MEVMIDLETLDTSPNSVIATIGAVKFNRNEISDDIDDYEKFYRRIDIDSCKEIGLTSSQDTLNWWDSQTKEARKEVFGKKNRVHIKKCLQDFKKWFKGCTKIWSHGDDFDCVILKNAFDKCGIVAPWKFWNTRDTRTLFDVKNYRYNKKDYVCVEHHALHDAFCQTIALLECFKK